MIHATAETLRQLAATLEYFDNHPVAYFDGTLDVSGDGSVRVIRDVEDRHIVVVR